MRLRRHLLVALLGLGTLPGHAHAGNLELTPVQVELSARATSALVSLRNAGPDPVRYQVSLFSWRQDPQGEMQLEPTDEVIFFPALLSLAPGEQRNLRVGAVAKFGDVEKSYRLFVEELPPLDKQAVAGRVRVLTRVGVPVFLEPARPKARAELADLALEAARFSFRLHNAGNVRIRPRAVRAVARGAKGEILSEQGLDVWYVLAGGDRLFRTDVPKERCAAVRILSAEVSLEAGELRAEMPAPRGACAP